MMILRSMYICLTFVLHVSFHEYLQNASTLEMHTLTRHSLNESTLQSLGIVVLQGEEELSRGKI